MNSNCLNLKALILLLNTLVDFDTKLDRCTSLFEKMNILLFLQIPDYSKSKSRIKLLVRH